MEVLPQSKRNQNRKVTALEIEWNAPKSQTNAIDLIGGKNCDRFEQSGAFNPFRNVFSQPVLAFDFFFLFLKLFFWDKTVKCGTLHVGDDKQKIDKSHKM